jgi:hypothetical protein
MPSATDTEFDSCDDIQHLLAEGILKPDTSAHLVARQAIALGIGSLSNRQRFIYDVVIAPALEGLAVEERRGAVSKAA